MLQEVNMEGGWEPSRSNAEVNSIDLRDDEADHQEQKEKGEADQEEPGLTVRAADGLRVLAHALSGVTRIEHGDLKRWFLEIDRARRRKGTRLAEGAAEGSEVGGGGASNCPICPRSLVDDT
uniref:Uncharacterized protein n=1 Tax=Steinernema glaseri TaxID=37863 RepID=A0A1I7YYJ0_9BILA